MSNNDVLINMDDNNSTVFVQNNVLYNLSSIALVSNTNELVNVIQSDLPNNAIFLTAEQLQSLGLQVDLNNDLNNAALQIEKPNIILNQPHQLQVEKPNLIINQSNNNGTSTVKVQKLQSVLINNQNPVKLNETNNLNVPQKVQIFKQIIAKTPDSNISQQIIKKPIHQNGVKKKIIKKKKIRVIKPDNLQVKIDGQVPKSIEKVTKVIKPMPNDLFAKKSSTNDKSNIKIDNLRQNDILDETAVTLKSVRTRSGRITKPPKHLKRDTRMPEEIKLNPTEPTKLQTITTEVTKPNLLQHNTENLLIPLTNIQRHLKLDTLTPMNTSIIPTEVDKTLINNPPLALPLIPTQKRKIASTKYRCKTCQRFYLGRAKMKKHLKLNPDHKVPKKYESDNQLWLDLLERTYNAPKSEQVKVFIGELSNILDKVKNLVPKGLKPLQNESDPNCFKIDSTLSTLLGVSEGKYVLDIEVLNGTNPLPSQEKFSTDLSILGSLNSAPMDTLIDEKILDSTENVVQTSLLNLLDTGQVHFDTENSNTSEAVRCVDQLVNERLKILTDIVELNPIHSSSSLSPPNITLDLSMDMFPYTS